MELPYKLKGTQNIITDNQLVEYTLICSVIVGWY